MVFEALLHDGRLVVDVLLNGVGVLAVFIILAVVADLGFKLRDHGLVRGKHQRLQS